MGGIGKYRPLGYHLANIHAASTERIAEDARLRSEDLMLDVEKLFMITEALWTVVKKQNNLKDENLHELINEIDMRGGKIDGRRKKEERPNCTQCGRKIMGRNTVCLYCGATAKLDPFKKY